MYRSIFFALLLILQIGYSHASSHLTHTSTTQINLTTKTGVMMMRINFFKDDLILTLSKFSKKQIALTDSNINEVVLKYLQKNLKLKPQKGKSIKYKCTGNRMDETFAIFEYEATGIHTISKMKITNTIMIDIFSNQSNVVNTYEDTWHQLLFLTKDKKVDRLQ